MLVTVVVLFQENSILLLSERLESSGWQFLRLEVSQESPKDRLKIGKSRPSKGPSQEPSKALRERTELFTGSETRQGSGLAEARSHESRPETSQENAPPCQALTRLIFADFCRFFGLSRETSTPDGLDSRSLRALWELKNRVLLEEYSIFNVTPRRRFF